MPATRARVLAAWASLFTVLAASGAVPSTQAPSSEADLLSSLRRISAAVEELERDVAGLELEKARAEEQFLAGLPGWGLAGPALDREMELEKREEAPPSPEDSLPRTSPEVRELRRKAERLWTAYLLKVSRKDVEAFKKRANERNP